MALEKVKAGSYKGVNKAGKHVEIVKAGAKYKGSNVWRVYIEGDYKPNLDGLSLESAKKKAGF